MYILFIPFFGTLLGAAGVFLCKQMLNDYIQRLLLGFAAGVMIAASIWSLLIPAIDMSEHLNFFSFLPATIGFIAGICLLFIINHIVSSIEKKEHNIIQNNNYANNDNTISNINTKNNNNSNTSNNNANLMLLLAVTIHNIPEGMAIGVIYAGFLNNSTYLSLASILTLAIGIAIQNIPEGAIISLPMHTSGYSKSKSFIYGVGSGIIEPIAAIITLLISSFITSALPYFLSFAAGSMIFVVIQELIPEATADNKKTFCTIGFTIGFVIMMILDVALG